MHSHGEISPYPQLCLQDMSTEYQQVLVHETAFEQTWRDTPGPTIGQVQVHEHRVATV